MSDPVQSTDAPNCHLSYIRTVAEQGLLRQSVEQLRRMVPDVREERSTRASPKTWAIIGISPDNAAAHGEGEFVHTMLGDHRWAVGDCQRLIMPTPDDPMGYC